MKKKTEIVKLVTLSATGGERSFMGIYVPPKTNAWNRSEYENTLEDTVKETEEMVGKGKDVMTVGDFNCKDINWEDKTAQGGDNSHSERLLSWS